MLLFVDEGNYLENYKNTNSDIDGARSSVFADNCSQFQGSSSNYWNARFAQCHHYDRWKISPSPACAICWCDQPRRRAIETILATECGTT